MINKAQLLMEYGALLLVSFPALMFGLGTREYGWIIIWIWLASSIALANERHKR